MKHAIMQFWAEPVIAFATTCDQLEMRVFSTLVVEHTHEDNNPRAKLNEGQFLALGLQCMLRNDPEAVAKYITMGKEAYENRLTVFPMQSYTYIPSNEPETPA